MNKTEFVSRVAQNGDGMSTAEATKAVAAVLAEIQDALSKGEDVAFAGFGKFTVSHRAARTGVNPQDPQQEGRDPRPHGAAVHAGRGAQGGRRPRRKSSPAGRALVTSGLSGA